MFDKDGGRIIFFEGTYTTTFSGNPDPTPRYDYNQVMYQLDLSDPRLALPVAIYEDPSGPGRSTRLVTKTLAGRSRRHAAAARRLLRTRPPGDRVAAGVRAIRRRRTVNPCLSLPTARHTERTGARPLFFILPADVKDYTAATVPLYEYREEGSGRRFYSVEAPSPNARSRWTPKLLGRVWRNPGAFASLVMVMPTGSGRGREPRPTVSGFRKKCDGFTRARLR